MRASRDDAGLVVPEAEVFCSGPNHQEGDGFRPMAMEEGMRPPQGLSALGAARGEHLVRAFEGGNPSPKHVLGTAHLPCVTPVRRDRTRSHVHGPIRTIPDMSGHWSAQTAIFMRESSFQHWRS